MIFIPILNYSIERPYNILSIGAKIFINVFMVIFFYYFFDLYGREKIIQTNIQNTLWSFFIFLSIYIFFYKIMLTGFHFFFTEIINPESLLLTPEFNKYALNILSGFILIFYRLNNYLNNRLGKLIEKITDEVILFSLTLYLYSSIALSTGVQLNYDILNDIQSVFKWGIGFFFLNVVIELYVIWFLKENKHRKTEHSMIAYFLNPFKKSPQTSLIKYIKPESQKRPTMINKFNKYNFTIFNRNIKGNQILSLVLIMLSIITIYFIYASDEATIIAPMYYSEIQIITFEDVPPNYQLINSEEIESMNAKRGYIIPLVTIKYNESQFTAPLNNRFQKHNSTNFKVNHDNTYLYLYFKMKPVNYSIQKPIIKSIELNQLNNYQFNFGSFYREAEIYYCLFINGYTNIYTITHLVPSPTIISINKYIYASNEKDDLLITIEKKRESLPILDNTIIYTKNDKLYDDMKFLFEQSKISTSFYRINDPIKLPFIIEGR